MSRIGMALAASLAAVVIEQALMPSGADARAARIVDCTHEIAPTARSLADSIQHDFGERPDVIAFGGRDTIKVVFCNPGFWRNDMQSKWVPPESMPTVTKATTHVAHYVWKTFGRDSGYSVIRIAFIRMFRETNGGTSSSEVPAEEVSGLFSRQMLETGQAPMMATALREGGAWDPAVQKRLDSIRAARASSQQN